MLYNYRELEAQPEELDSYVNPSRETARSLRPSISESGPWEPIHHGQLRSLILEEATSRGLTVAREVYNFGRAPRGHKGIDPNGGPESVRNPHQLFGSIEFEQPIPGRADARMAIGFRHCNLQTFQLTVVAGGYVTVCSNGIISGEHVGKMKHENVGGMLLGTVQNAFIAWQDQQQRAGRFLAAMERAELSDDQAARLLLEATRDVIDPERSTETRNAYRRRACLSSSRVARCWDLWLDRGRNDGAFEDRNAWSLYNAVNEHAKGYRPRVAETAVRGFGAMLADELVFDETSTPSLALVPVDPELN